MPVTSSLKQQVDLPVWEWLRPLPFTSNATSSTTSNKDKRYIYYVRDSNFFRYDTVTDGWQQLASTIYTPANCIDLGYSSSHGYYGRAISNGGGNNTIELAGLQGNVLVGKKIRITSGTGAGQERTITSISEPIVHEKGPITSASATALVDGSTGALIKQWEPNRFRDYQIKFTYGSVGNTSVRKILYNFYNQAVISDTGINSWNMWNDPRLPVSTSTTAATNTHYQIESHIATVDSPWNVQPDSSSSFMVMTDGIWLLTSRNDGNFYHLNYYDVAADTWYGRMTQGFYFNAFSTDCAIESIQDNSVPYLSGTITSATSSTFTDSLLALSANYYNNFQVRLLSGTGMGQERTICANTSSTFINMREWDVIPDATTTYGVYDDTSKLYIVGGGYAHISVYNLESDQLTPGRQYDFGVTRIGSATINGFEPIAVTSATRATGGIRVLNPTPTAGGSGYMVGQVLTITGGGGTGGTAIVTGVSSAGAVTSVKLIATGSGYTAGTGRATTVVPAGGTGCTLDITTAGDVINVTTPVVHPFKIGDTVTIRGAITQTAINGTFTIIAIAATSSAATQFTVAVDGTSGNPTFNAHTTTTIFDVAKDWIPNEHAGKIIQFYTATTGNPPQATITGAVRRIVSNTANSITFLAAGSTPPNGVRYVIFSDKALTNERTLGASFGSDNFGIAMSASSSGIFDSTKNWPANYWSNTFPTGASNTQRRVKIVAGTEVGLEANIISNTSNTLTLSAPRSFSLDNTSVYEIADAYGLATSGSSTQLVDTTQNWGTNALIGKTIRFTSGTSHGNTGTITSNTQTTVNFSATTAPDTTTTYAVLAPMPRSTGINLFNITKSTKSVLNGRYFYAIRGGGFPEIARWNLATQYWEQLTTFPFTESFTTGSMYAYDDKDRIYITRDATGRVMYYNIVTNEVIPSGFIPYGMSTAVIGNRMDIIETVDGLQYLYIPRHSGQEYWRSLIYW